MDGVLRQIVTNLSSIILALLLAAAVWIAATLQADPFSLREFAGVPVEPINQPENTVFFEGEEAYITVEVRAPQSVLSDLNVNEFRAIMDLSMAQIGDRSTVPISVTLESEVVRIEGYNPGRQVVHLERIGSVTRPVEIEVQGDVATGYQANAPIVRPEQVTIQGPVPYLTEIVTVTGSINIDGARSDIARKVSIVPRNEEGELVGGVTFSPQDVDVSVGVRRRVGFKPDVQVVPDLRGDPAPGYRRASVSVEPSTVTLAGPRSVLDDLPGFVKTLPISVTGATADLVRSTAITVPAGVVVAEGSYVTVTVEILPVLSSRTLTDEVEIQGLPQGRVATLSPEAVEIIIVGPDALLSQLTPAAVQIYVNLFGYPIGVHRVQLQAVVPEGLEIVSIIPEAVEVEIELSVTPTPVDRE
jgi:YbbR domain-containing protein